MVCREVRERLTPFLDDEMDPVASREVQDHLRSCPDCAAVLANLESTREVLRRDLEYHRAPDLLRARILRDVRTVSRPDRGATRRGQARAWAWLGAAAAVLVVAGGAWWAAFFSGGAANEALAREAVSGHVRSLMADHLTDVASTDQHTVKPWFAGKLDFSPPVTDFAAAGYPLIGGRLDYLHGRAVAALVYQRRKHVINVFVWPVSDGRDQVGAAVTQQGFHVIRGTHARMAFWVVSDLNTDELTAFARMFAAPPKS